MPNHWKNLSVQMTRNTKKIAEDFFPIIFLKSLQFFIFCTRKKNIKTANIYCNNKHTHFDLNEERKCHLGKQVIVPCTICLKKNKIKNFLKKSFNGVEEEKIQKKLICVAFEVDSVSHYLLH